MEESLNLVENGNYIYPIQEDSIAMQMSKQRCNLVYVTKGLSHFKRRKEFFLFRITSEIFSFGFQQQQRLSKNGRQGDHHAAIVHSKNI